MNLAFATRAARSRTPRPRALPDDEGAFPPLAAGILAVGLVGLAGVLAATLPHPGNSPRVKQWYDNLDKPAATPPDFVFGLAWPAIEACLAFSGFRLLSKPHHAAQRRVAFLASTCQHPRLHQAVLGDRN